MTNFQHLMLSPKMLKSQNPISGGGVGGVGGWVVDQLSRVNFKLSNLSPELKFPFPGVGVGGGW